MSKLNSPATFFQLCHFVHPTSSNMSKTSSQQELSQLFKPMQTCGSKGIRKPKRPDPLNIAELHRSPWPWEKSIQGHEILLDQAQIRYPGISGWHCQFKLQKEMSCNDFWLQAFRFKYQANQNECMSHLLVWTRVKNYFLGAPAEGHWYHWSNPWPCVPWKGAKMKGRLRLKPTFSHQNQLRSYFAIH